MIFRILAGIAAVIILALVRRARRGRREVWVIRPYTAPPPARKPPVPVPGLPRDGEPLDLYERRILGYVETDAWIRVPEPDYDTGEKAT